MPMPRAKKHNREAEKQAVRRKTKRRWRRWRRGGGAQLQLRTVRFQTVHVLW